MLNRLSLGGNPNLGVYARTTEEFVFISSHATAKELASFTEALEVKAVPVTVGGTHLVGSLLAANSNGIVVSDILTAREESFLKATGLPILRLDHTLNAAGNMLLVNNRGGMVGVEYPEDVTGTIEDTLGIRLSRGTLAELVTLGMAAAVTERGLLVHPKSTPEEREAARRALGVDVMPGTINHGTGLIGAGIVANSHGAAIGSATTGIEIGRIDEALGYLDAKPTATG